MGYTRNIFITAFLALALTARAQYTEQINSNRPGLSMGGYAVGKTILQIESGISGIHEQHDIMRTESNGVGVDLQMRYGLFMEELEFVADMQYRFDQFQETIFTTNRNDFSRFTLGAKYMVYDPNKYYEPTVNIKSFKANRKFKWRSLIPTIALYAGVNLFTDNPYTFPEDKLSPKGMLILHNNFGRWVWVNNIIADKIGTEYPSYGWITTVTRGFNEHWSGFVEFQAYKSDYYSDGIARMGAAYLLNDNMQFDASISSNFKDTPTVLYGGVGFSWRFTANYQDVLLPGKGDREDLLKEDMDKQKKEKDKRKKDKEKRLRELEAPMGPQPE